MKLNPRVSQLALYDIRLGPGPLIPQRIMRRSGIDRLCEQVSQLISVTSTPGALSRATTLLLLGSEKLWRALRLSSSRLVSRESPA
jgi:hypothetical protein